MLTVGFVLYNEEKNVQRIEQNMAQLAAKGISILLIDNASTDSSSSKLKDLAERFSATFHRRVRNHMGEARADVIRLAKTEWVGFVDGDCQLPQAWSQQTLDILDTPLKVSAVGGPLLPAGPNRSLFKSLFQSYLGNVNSTQVKNFSHVKIVPHLSSSNVIYRKKDVLEVGNFSSLKSRVGEDLEMSYRLRKAGKTLAMHPRLALEHELPSSLKPWLKKVFSYGMARGEVGWQHGALWTWPFFPPLAFFLFLIGNLIFWPSLKGMPFFIYLVVVALASGVYGGKFALRLGIYFIGTHMAYSFGMIFGLLKAILPVSRASHEVIKGEQGKVG